MADKTDFILEFRAEKKKLQQEIADIKKETENLRRDAKKSQRQEMQYDQQRTRGKTKVRKEDDKHRKLERRHVQDMSKEEQKRHKASLVSLQKLHNENQKLIKRNERLEQRLGRGGGGRGGAGGQGQPGGRRGFWNGLGIGAGAATVGLGLWNFLVGGATAGYQRHVEYGSAMGRNAGLGRGRDIRKGVRGAMGSKLGFSLIDSAQQVPLMGRATGELGPRELQQAMRATGQDAGEVSDLFGTLRRAGISFSGAGKGRQSAGGREVQKLISAGMASGLERARLPEYFRGVQTIVEQQRQLFTGTVNVSDIAKTLAVWGKSGRAGMQGEAGANLYSKVTGAISGGSGNDFAQMLFLRAMGFGKPGGQTGYYEAEKRREGAGRDPSVVMDVMKQMQSEFGGFGRGGKQEAALSMREAFGVTLEQAEALQDIYSSSSSMEDKQKQIADIMKASEPLEKQSLDAMKDIGGMLKRIAGKTDEGIGIGAKSAKIIEEWEDLQLGLLKKLIHGVEVMTAYTKEIRDFFYGASDAKKNAAKAAEIANQPLSDDPVTRQQQISERQRQVQKLKSESGSAGIVSDVLSGGVANWRELLSGKSTLTDLVTGKGFEGFTKHRKSRLELDDAERKLRKQEIDNYDGPMTDEIQRYLSDGGEPPQQLIDWEANRKKRKRSGGVVPSTPVPTDAGTTGGESSSTSTSEQLPVKLSFMIGTSDPRVQPTMAPQNPGRGSVMPTRGVG